MSVLMVFCAHASAQNCAIAPDDGFHAISGITSGSYVTALAGFNDGSGDALYLGGEFSAAGNVWPLNSIARWNGEGISHVGVGFNGVVRDFVVFDDGTGPALFAGGSFGSADNLPANGLAKWTGKGWIPITGGPMGDIWALVVYDDGSGPAIFAGGASPPYIMKWNGQSWSTLGSGLNGDAHALAVFNNGAGPAVYVGGNFTQAGSQTANRIARWNGAWQSVGSGCNDDVKALCAVNLGTTERLYVGGSFTSPASRIASWDGVNWSSLGSGANQEIHSLAPHDDGSGLKLYAAGQFSMIDGIAAQRVARWNGANWESTGAGLTSVVYALQSITVNGKSDLYAGGTFTQNGSNLGSLDRIARWDGQQWNALGGKGLYITYATRMVTHNWGEGSRLIATGGFSNAGTLPSQGVAQWDGTQWHWMNGGSPAFGGKSSTVFTNNRQSRLVIAGSMSSIGGVAANNIAQWDGNGWSALGTGTNNPIHALAVNPTDSDTPLYAAGLFTQAGSASAKRVAKWDGTSWSGLNAAGTGPNSGSLDALAIYDDGAGPALFVGGQFGNVDGNTSLKNLVKWDGQNWTNLGVTGSVSALDVLDDGRSQSLYVRGSLSMVGGLPASNLARYSAGTWDNLLGGLNGQINDLAIYDDGTGPKLYVTGNFTLAGGQTCNRIAALGETGWNPLGPLGLSGIGLSLAVFDDGTGPALFVGGDFLEAGGLAAHGIAKWDGQVWSVIGTGMAPVSATFQGRVATLGVGPSAMLCVSGSFTQFAGVPASRFAVIRACQPTQPPQSFTLTAPVETFGHPVNPTLSWTSASGLFVRYNLVLASDADLQNVVFTQSSLIGTSVNVPAGILNDGSRYYWTVVAENPLGETRSIPLVAMFGTKGGADVNVDGIVNVYDLLMVINSWGSCPLPPNTCAADVNEDGFVNVTDLLQVIDVWGPFP